MATISYVDRCKGWVTEANDTRHDCGWCDFQSHKQVYVDATDKDELVEELSLWAQSNSGKVETG